MCKTEIQVFQTMCSLELYCVQHFILFVNGQPIHCFSVELKEKTVNLPNIASQSEAWHSKKVMQTEPTGPVHTEALGYSHYYTKLI